MNPLFTIYKNEIIINNITSIKEFSEKEFIIEIDTIPYEIKGNNLILKEVINNNQTIIINGELFLIQRKNMIKEKNKSFIKKLFS